MMLRRIVHGVARPLAQQHARSMAIAVGSKFPSVEVDDAKWPPAPYNLADKIADKKVIVVGLPGAFTPTWSKDQVPGYKKARNEVREAGIDEVLIYCVNDAAVMEAWAKDQKIAGTNISFFADTTGALTKALDLEMPAPGPMRDLGNLRSKRFGLYVDNGVIKHVAVSGTDNDGDDPAGDAPGANANSAVTGMLAAIKAL